MAVDIRSTAKISLDVINTNDDEQNLSAEHKIEVDETRSFGAGATQVDAVYSELPVTLAVSTPLTLDLQSLTDTFGAALSFQKIFWLAIRNKSTVAGEVLTVGNAAATIWEPFVSAGGTVLVNAGGSFVWHDPAGVVVDASNKSLKLDPGAKTFGVDVLLIGTKS